MEKAYTTGDVAKVCMVAPRTVQKWMDSGALRSYRIPHGRDRRCLKADLVAFMVVNGLPTELIPDDDAGAADRVLVIGGDPAAFADSAGVEVTHVRTAFAAGIAYAEVEPTCVVVDIAAIGRIDASLIAASIKAVGVLLVAVCDAVDAPKGFDASIPPSGDLAQNNIGLKTAIYTASEVKAREAS